jgi:hypothetical protein
MFVIDPYGDTESTFWAPVTLRVPGGDAHKISVEFQELTDDEIDQVYADGGDDTTLIQRVVKNWKNVYRMEDGKQAKVEFSPETLEQLCQRRWFRQAVITTYIDHLSGKAVVRRAERRAKN